MNNEQLTCREAFEKWFDGKSVPLEHCTDWYERDDDGIYIMEEVQCAWAGWQAASNHYEQKQYTSIKSCPFCGGLPEFYDGDSYWKIECLNAGCLPVVSVERSTKNEAIKAWNRRSSSEFNSFPHTKAQHEILTRLESPKMVEKLRQPIIHSITTFTPSPDPTNNEAVKAAHMKWIDNVAKAVLAAIKTELGV